jgi:aminoglycoside/choline kinase family phosphotransferase
MSHREIPLSLESVDSDWLNQVLQDALSGDRVVGFTSKTIGEGAGFLGDIARLNLQLENESAELASVILKMPTGSINRKMGQLIGVYEREIRFYQELQPALDIRTPKHYYSAMDATDPAEAVRQLTFLNRVPDWVARLLLTLTKWGSKKVQRYVLILEDLGRYRIGDQVGGASTTEVKLALDTLAGLHAGFFNKDLSGYPWIIPIDLGARFTQLMVDSAKKHFRKSHAAVLKNQHIELLDWLDSHAQDLMDLTAELPFTLLHGDYRLDNLCFDDDKDELVVFDWQTLIRGPVGLDLAYFLSATLDDDTSDETLDELLEHYRTGLNGRGVDMSRERVRFEYDLGMLGTVNRVLLMEAQDFEFGEGRGTELLDQWLSRVLFKAIKLNPNRLLQGVPD